MLPVHCLNRLTISTGKTIALGIAALLAWNIYSRARAAGSLTFFPGKIKKFDWNNGSPVITFELLVQNTSNHTFNLLSIAGNVFSLSNGKQYLIGYISDFRSQTVAPVSESTLQVQARLQLTGVVGDLINAFTSGDYSQEIHLAANANVDYIQVPIDYTYKLAI